MVVARVTNHGDQRDRDIVSLRVDDRVVATKGVRVDAGETESLTFERTLDGQGDHDMAVDGMQLPAVTVVTPGDEDSPPTSQDPDAVELSGQPTAEPGQVEVVAADGLADWVRDGYNASVRATLVNRGNQTATYSMPITVDGQRVANETVLVLPGGRTNVSVEFPAAEGTVLVDGTEAGTLTVGDAWGGTPVTDHTTEGSGPGLGLGLVAHLLVVAALVGGATRLVRRR